MIIALRTQFHIERPWGQRLKCERGSSRFQPGEGPSKGLLRDYKPSDRIRMVLFEALAETQLDVFIPR